MKIYKNMTNIEVTQLLRSVAAAYEVKNEAKNRFKIIAYRRAADAVEHLTSEVKDLWDDGKLQGIPSIGENISKHLDEIFRTGKSKHFKFVMKGLPPAMFELMKISGIGAKTALKLAKKLGIKEQKGAFKKLERAVEKGQVSDIPGFGQQSEVSIKKSISETKDRNIRLLLPQALNISGELTSWLKRCKFAKEIDVLGSLRRKTATVGDVDIAVATDNPQAVVNHFTLYPKTKRIVEKGPKSASIIISGNRQVDLMVSDLDSYGAMLQHFTGSKHHNIALREYAQKQGMSLSEYGIKRNLAGGRKKLQKFSTEEKLYKKLGMDWIPPELREDSGEIEAALSHKLPRLVKLEEIRGDLHIHSDFDIETSHDLGESSMEEIVRKASGLQYEYIAFTEHNPSQRGHTDKQIIDLLKRKRERIDKLNSSLVKGRKVGVKKVFNSLELDILPSGKLPLSEKALEILDFVLVALHSSLRQGKEKMTKRVLSSFEYPKVKIFSHPTTRILNRREGVEFNWPKLFAVCKEKNIWLEINANPLRLDIPDVIAHEAVKSSVKLTISTDAHHKDGLDNMPYGVFVGQRGWARKEDIINTKNLNDFQKMLI